ncbi:hypothetical protein GCAAIG_12835 [Candidatus Electronema halotolerans]
MKPYPKYKDSGVEWIGELPEEWAVVKVKYLVKDHSGNGFPHDEQGNLDGDIPFLKVSDINGNEKYVEKANNYVSKDTIEKHNWNLIPVNSLVTAKIGESLRKNHRKIILKSCIIDNNCIGIEPDKLNWNFNFYLHSIIDFDWFVNPGAVPSLSVEKYKSFYCAIPCLQEQTTIAAFLDRKTAEIDSLIAKKERQIELLKEYRTALISEAVTGKIDVRDYASVQHNSTHS